MSERRLPAWLALALPLLLLAIVPFFFLGGPDFLSSPIFRSVWDLGHIGFFALLLIAVQWRKPLPHLWQWLWVAALVLAIGGAIEFLQAYVGRDGNFSDAFKNLVGAALGLFWGQRANRQIWIARGLTVIALMPSLWSVVQVALVEYETGRRFPLLADFENRRDLMHWRGDISRSSDFANRGSYSLKVNLSTAQYSGADFYEFVADWTAYQQFAFDIYNPDEEPLALVLRIHDAEHDRAGPTFKNRFNQKMVANPGWNHFVFSLSDVRTAPAEREMDLLALRGLSIFAVQSPVKRSFYLDHLRLE